MGLTIHYNLTTDLTKPNEIRQVVETVRQFALDLPFENVSELYEFTGNDPKPENESARWLRAQSEQHVVIDGYYHPVPPKHCFAFSIFPGKGCESANFGFCKFPLSINVDDKRVATKLRGWSWTSFCKTQYASDPRCGGVPHFLRCHLGVVKILDFINLTSLAKAEVNDEGGFWDKRDMKALVQEIGEWNELLAGLTSQLRATSGQELEAAITNFPNFEHLEAKGLERLAKLRKPKNS